VKIVHVANGFPPTAIAGVEQYTHALARQQMQRHRVAVFCREYAPERADYTVLDEEQAGLPVRRVVNNFGRASGLETHYLDPTIEKLFAAYLHEMRPDIVHFQHCIGLSAGLPAIAREAGVPFVLTLPDYWYICPTTRLLTRDLALCPGPHHSADCRQCLGAAVQVSGLLHRLPFYAQMRDALVPASVQRRVLRWLARARPAAPPAGRAIPAPFARRTRFMQQTLNAVPQLLALSDFCRQVYLDYGLRPAAIRTLPWGLDLDRWQQSPPRAPSPDLRFGYIGALAAHKGVDVLLRAFRRLSRPDVALHLFGFVVPDDPFGACLRGIAAGDPRIHFRGRYDNARLPELLAGVDAVVVPSRWHETFSLVTREALLAGLPVVASRVGGIPEAVTDGLNGLLVPPSDEAALAAALARLADDRALLARLAQAAVSTPVKSIQAHALEVEGVYQELVDETHG